MILFLFMCWSDGHLWMPSLPSWMPSLIWSGTLNLFGGSQNPRQWRLHTWFTIRILKFWGFGSLNPDYIWTLVSFSFENLWLLRSCFSCVRAGWISRDKRFFERREKTRYSERRVTFMDVGQNSPEVEVFEENIPNVHCRTSIALGELQLGGFQMGAGGCWAPLQWEVVSGWERLLGPNLAPTWPQHQREWTLPVHRN